MSVTVNSQWLQLTLQQQQEEGGSSPNGAASFPSCCHRGLTPIGTHSHCWRWKALMWMCQQQQSWSVIHTLGWLWEGWLWLFSFLRISAMQCSVSTVWQAKLHFHYATFQSKVLTAQHCLTSEVLFYYATFQRKPFTAQGNLDLDLDDMKAPKTGSIPTWCLLEFGKESNIFLFFLLFPTTHNTPLWIYTHSLQQSLTLNIMIMDEWLLKRACRRSALQSCQSIVSVGADKIWLNAEEYKVTKNFWNSDFKFLD